VGRVTGTELMPRLVGGNTETVCSKLKNRNSLSKPNFELGPSHRQVRQVRRVNRWFSGDSPLSNFQKFLGQRI
jgi:hypothetical protein